MNTRCSMKRTVVGWATSGVFRDELASHSIDMDQNAPAPQFPSRRAETDQLLQRMLEISTVGIIFFDASGDIVDANAAFLQMSGFTQQEVTARQLRWDTLTPPEWMQRSLEAIHQLKTQGSTVPYEKEYYRKDGSRFRGLFAAKGLSESHGVEFILDITEKHRAEELLKESEERFRQLSETSPIGIYQADLHNNVTYANAMAQKIFEMSEEELIGQGWLSRLCPEDAALVAEQWPKAIAENRSYEIEYRLQLPDGDIRLICAHSVMLHSDDGTSFGVVGTVEDITSRKRAEETLRETEKLAAVGRLAASIAHEINNPLESVTNLLYLARSSRDINEVQEYLGTAERELRRVSAISSQTLRFHRQSTKAKGLVMADLIAEVLSIYQGRLINSRIEVEERCDKDVAITCFDGEIRQVLNNLIGNAVDAMHSSGGRLLIRCNVCTRWSDGRRGIAVTIADNGPGIPPLVRKKIFDAFYTTKGIGGSGLGLWISKDILQRHAGAITVRSNQTEGSSGTVFRMFLPFDLAAAVDKDSKTT
jgi:PAS domain S-box-containing protein